MNAGMIRGIKSKRKNKHFHYSINWKFTINNTNKRNTNVFYNNGELYNKNLSQFLKSLKFFTIKY